MNNIKVQCVVNINIAIGAIASALLGSAAFALRPPTGDESPCRVTGVVLRLHRVESLDSLDNRIMVPAVTLEVLSIKSLDESYKGSFCNPPSLIEQPELYEGKKRMNAYRLCDGSARLRAGDRITGIIGKSAGGDPYCMDDIQELGP